MALATHDDAFKELARNTGDKTPERCWLLTDWDVWVLNPHYVGEPQPHPETLEF